MAWMTEDPQVRTDTFCQCAYSHLATPKVQQRPSGKPGQRHELIAGIWKMGLIEEKKKEVLLVVVGNCLQQARVLH